MKKYLLLIALIMSAMPFVEAQEPVAKVYNDTLNTMEQIDRAVATAREQGKFVVCQVGGNWCPWCLRFARFIAADEEISRLIDENFVYIHVSYNPHETPTDEKVAMVAATMRRLGNPARFGFPVLVVLDGDGRVVHIQDSGYLEEGKGYDREKVLRFFKNWTPAAVIPRP